MKDFRAKLVYRVFKGEERERNERAAKAADYSQKKKNL